jgi:hypothetical protein
MEHYKNDIEKFTNFDLLKQINNYGIWAGGSLVCMFNKDFECIGDIDIFTNTIENGYKIIEFIKNYDQNVIYETFQGKYKTSVVNCIIKNSKPIQIIVKNYLNWCELIEEFDLDYVQCGFFKNHFYSSASFEKSFKNKEITMFNKNLSSYRCFKAAKKGYKTKVFNLNNRFSTDGKWNPVNTYELVSMDFYFKKDESVFNMKSVKFDKIENAFFVLNTNGGNLNAHIILIRIESPLKKILYSNFKYTVYLLGYLNGYPINFYHLHKNSNKILDQNLFLVKVSNDSKFLLVVNKLIKDEKNLIPLYTVYN